MSVYVDDMQARFRSMIMCHMGADTTEELLAMADRIGVSRRWLQCKGTYKEHFDICLSMRARAIAEGAKEITQRELAMIFDRRRKRQRFDGWIETMRREDQEESDYYRSQQKHD